MAATDEMCRVSIRTADHEADVMLPAHVPIAELIPAVVDLIGKDDFADTGPHLTRVSGEVLDTAATLAQCAIPDGELLMLTSVAARPARVVTFDVSTAVVDTVASLTRPSWPAANRRAGSIVLCWTTAVLLVLLVWGQPGLPGFLLAMSATSATSLFAWRLLDWAPLVFLPLATVAMAAAAATVGAVAGWWPPTACGPMLATASVATLAVSARLSVHSAGLSAAGTELDRKTRAAHRRLTVLTATAAAAAALGAGVTAVTAVRPFVAAGFIAVVGTALLLRSCRQIDPYHVVMLAIASGAAATSLVLLCAIKVPASTPWLCAGLLVVGSGAVWCRQGGRWRLAPATRRAIALLDVAVSAAVVPTAAAAAGVFEALPGIGQP